MDDPHSQSAPVNSRSPYHSPRGQAHGGAGKAPGGLFASSSNMSGMSSRTSPLGGSPGPNKSVAFSKPPSTVIPVESPGASSSLTRMGPSFGNASCGTGTSAGGGGGHQSSLRVGPRLRAEGLMVPPASDAATLRRQVAALQIDLEAHIDGEQRLQSINQQLRERLELYMKQNHENVERAESELNTLHEDMEQTLELQRRLAQRATALEKEKKDLETVLQRRVLEFEGERNSLQSRIQTMSEDLRARTEAQEKVNQLQAELMSTLDVKSKLEERLESFAKESAYLKKKADDYSQELRDLILKEQLDQRIDKMGEKGICRRFFMRFQEGIREQCIDKANEVHAFKQYKLHCCKHIMLALRKATHRACLLRQAYERQCKTLVHDCWRAWHVTAIAQRKCAASLKRKAVARKIHSLHSWVAYVIRLRLNPERITVAIAHWTRKSMQKSFDKWLQTLRSWKLGEKEERSLTIRAQKFWNRIVVRGFFNRWIHWLNKFARPKKRKFAAVQAHINKMTMKQAMAAWRCIIHVKWVRRMKFEEAATQDILWRRRRTISRLREAIREVKLGRLRLSQGIVFRKYKQGHTVVKHWRKFVQHKHHMRVYKQMAFRHYLHSLRVKSVQVWRDNVNYQKAQHRATLEVNQALTRAAMVFWRDHHVYHSIKKKKERKAGVFRKRREVKMAKWVLGSWWEQMAWKRRAIQLDCLLAIRRRRTLLIQSMHAWMHATFDGLLLANAKFHEDLLEAQAQFEEQKHQVTTVDVENLQLIDRLHTMSSEIAFLKTTISDKDKQEEDLHHALEDGAVLESSMRGEIEQQHIRAEELELEILSLQKKLQMKNAEDTAGEVHHTLEIQNLEQALKELRIQLAEKTSQIDSYEKALKETAERLEGASDESQEKLTSAFEIAGSLRKLLEERETQFATLEGNCRRRELELGEVQRKLAVANCTLCETVESRDARIQELENVLSLKQHEVQETQQQLQDLELAMDAKDSRVRKLEYEIKLMSEQNSLKAKTFVSSLSSWSATPVNDANGALRGGLHSIQVKESMRHAYVQAKSALQQQGSADSDDGGSGLISSASGQARTYTYASDPSSTNPDEPPQHEFMVPPPLDVSMPVDMATETHDPQAGGPADDDEALDMETHTILYQGQDTSQPDWETSFALVSTTRPSLPGGMAEPGYGTGAPDASPQDRPPERFGGGGGTSLQASGEGPYRMVLDDDPGAVDSLHVEIQRLQARIMSRLRDSPSTGAESDSSNRIGGRTSFRPQPQSGPSSRRASDA